MSEETYNEWAERVELLLSGAITKDDYRRMIKEEIMKDLNRRGVPEN